MNDLLIKEWKEIQDLIRKLDIISLVSWDITTDNWYVIDVIPFPDVKLKALHYETESIEDMIDKLSKYYLRAKDKGEMQRFWDGVTSVWTTYINAMVFLWSLIFWGIIGICGYILWLTPMGAKFIEMLK